MNTQQEIILSRSRIACDDMHPGDRFALSLISKGKSQYEQIVDILEVFPGAIPLGDIEFLYHTSDVSQYTLNRYLELAFNVINDLLCEAAQELPADCMLYIGYDLTTQHINLYAEKVKS